MTKTHKLRTALPLVALLSALLVSAPVLGHDPLRETHRREHHDHVVDHGNDGIQRDDVSKVRALVISFRETGDDRYLDEAWEILSAALATEQSDAAMLIAASFVAQSRHKFEYAVKLISQALTIQTNNDEAWLLLASINLVLGKVESADQACRQLLNVAPLVLLTCKARVALASGEHELAFARLIGVLGLADSQRLPAEVLAWTYSVAGDLAVGNDEPNRALQLYRRSLELAERTQVRAALVDVLLDQRRFEDAGFVLDNRSQALPLLVRRLIVAKRLNRVDQRIPELAQVQNEFDVWIANEDWLHAREMTRFFIDVVERPILARRLALINVGLQREPEDLRLEERTRARIPIAVVGS